MSNYDDEQLNIMEPGETEPEDPQEHSAWVRAKSVICLKKMIQRLEDPDQWDEELPERQVRGIYSVVVSGDPQENGLIQGHIYGLSNGELINVLQRELFDSMLQASARRIYQIVQTESREALREAMGSSLVRDLISEVQDELDTYTDDESDPGVH